MVVVVVQVIKSLSSGKKVGGDFTCATISPKVGTYTHPQTVGRPTHGLPASQTTAGGRPGDRGEHED